MHLHTILAPISISAFIAMMLFAAFSTGYEPTSAEGRKIGLLFKVSAGIFVGCWIILWAVYA